MNDMIEKLIKLRKDAGLTQANVAEALGVPRQTINKYEHELNVMTVQKLVDFAKFYNVSVDWLLGLSSTREINDPVQSDGILQDGSTTIPKS